MVKRSAATPLCATPKCKNKKAVLRVHPDGSKSLANYCGSCRSRRWRENHPIEYSYYNLKHRAEERGIPFHLTRKEFKGWCEKTGYHLLKAKSANGMSVDRIREKDPYQLNNLQMLTLSENSRKMHALKGHNTATPVSADEGDPF